MEPTANPMVSVSVLFCYFMGPIKIFKKAREGHYAVGQFNVSTDEQLRAIVEVAQGLKSPIIIGTSEGERKFIGTYQAVSLVETWKKLTKLPIILNADHCKSFRSAKEAVDAGYSAVHFDGSALSLEKNIKLTKKVVNYARRKNPDIIIEGELGYLRGGSELHKKKTEIKLEDLTKPEEAKKLVKDTGIDTLAVVVGNMHGIEASMKNPNLYLDRLDEIQKVASSTYLVLHGGSGTPEGDIKKAIKLGVIKININTELRIAYSNELRKTLKENPDTTKPYEILAPAMEAMKKVVEYKINLFGSKDRA